MFETCRDTQSGHNFQFGLFPSVFTLSAVFFCLEEIMMEEGKEWCGEHIIHNGFKTIFEVWHTKMGFMFSISISCSSSFTFQSSEFSSCSISTGLA